MGISYFFTDFIFCPLPKNRCLKPNLYHWATYMVTNILLNQRHGLALGGPTVRHEIIIAQFLSWEYSVVFSWPPVDSYLTCWAVLCLGCWFNNHKGIKMGDIMGTPDYISLTPKQQENLLFHPTTDMNQQCTELEPSDVWQLTLFGLTWSCFSCVFFERMHFDLFSPLCLSLSAHDSVLFEFLFPNGSVGHKHWFIVAKQ